MAHIVSGSRGSPFKAGIAAVRVPLTRGVVALLTLVLLATGTLFIGDAMLYRPAWGEAVVPLSSSPTPTPAQTRGRSPEPSRPPHPTPSITVAPTRVVRRTPASRAALRGTILFLTDREGVDPWDLGAGGAVYVMNADGSNQRRLAQPAIYDDLAAWEPWSRGRQQAAIVEWNRASSSYDLFIHNAADGWTFYATGGRADEYSPAWSPVDNRIAYVTGEDGNDEIHVWDLDTRRDRRLTFDPQWDKHPTWAPDGARLAFWSNRATGRKQVWCMTADGRDLRNLSSNPWNDWDPIWVK